MGVVNGLAVYGPNLGTLIEVEAVAIPTEAGRNGQVQITGIVDEEETGDLGRTMRRKSLARSSIDNVLTVLRANLGVRPQDYDIHINFPAESPSTALRRVYPLLRPFILLSPSARSATRWR